MKNLLIILSLVIGIFLFPTSVILTFKYANPFILVFGFATSTIFIASALFSENKNKKSLVV